MPSERAGRFRGFGEIRGDLAPLVLRVFLAVFLVDLALGRLTSPALMAGFTEALERGGLALSPARAAQGIAWFQLVAGAAIALGIMTRLVSLLTALLFGALGVLLLAGEPLAAWLGSGGIIAAALALWLGGPGPCTLGRLFTRR